VRSLPVPIGSPNLRGCLPFSPNNHRRYCGNRTPIFAALQPLAFTMQETGRIICNLTLRHLIYRQQPETRKLGGGTTLAKPGRCTFAASTPYSRFSLRSLSPTSPRAQDHGQRKNNFSNVSCIFSVSLIPPSIFSRMEYRKSFSHLLKRSSSLSQVSRYSVSTSNLSFGIRRSPTNPPQYGEQRVFVDK
jgi:hypothetical protein